MPSSKNDKARGVVKKAQEAAKEDKKPNENKKFCVECFGRNPDHKDHCSWNAGSKAAKANIVSPDDRGTNFTVARVAGGYVGKIRGVSDPWGLKTGSKDATTDDNAEKEETDKVVENDFVMIEGEWVEI